MMYSPAPTIVRYALALQHLSAREAIKYGWSIYQSVKREEPNVRWIDLPKFVRIRAHDKGIVPVYGPGRVVLWGDTINAR